MYLEVDEISEILDGYSGACIKLPEQAKNR